MEVLLGDDGLFFGGELEKAERVGAVVFVGNQFADPDCSKLREEPFYLFRPLIRRDVGYDKLVCVLDADVL